MTNYAKRHLGWGWLFLLVFLSEGLVLEALHAFKAGFYLDVHNEVRRLLWTLSHAHGTLLAVINICFSFTLKSLDQQNSTKWLQVASPSLLGATVLLPGGFFLGGLFIYSGDPGFGALLIPVGAALLILSVGLTVRAIFRPKPAEKADP